MPTVKLEPRTKTLIKHEHTPFQLIIIGGGPAGLTAGLYAKRFGLDVLLIEKAVPGGMITATEFVENYPGFSGGISGPDLGRKLEEHARKYGVDIVYGNALGLEKTGKLFKITTEEHAYTTRAVIIASGSEPKKLGVAGEDAFIGKGVSYCATCDAPFYKDKKIAVVGGGNSAIDEALSLAKFADLVTVIHRRDTLRADKVLIEKASADPKIFLKMNTVVEEIIGDEHVKSIRIKDLTTDKTSVLNIDGVFIYVGYKPNTELVKGLVKLDENGSVITDDKLATNVPGIFAAGDVRKKSLRQVITSVADGAIAASSVKEFLAQ